MKRYRSDDKCAWCGKEKAIESSYAGNSKVYCEACQRKLLKEFASETTLQEWENFMRCKHENQA